VKNVDLLVCSGNVLTKIAQRHPRVESLVLSATAQLAANS